MSDLFLQEISNSVHKGQLYLYNTKVKGLSIVSPHGMNLSICGYQNVSRAFGKWISLQKTHVCSDKNISPGENLEKNSGIS